MITEAEPDVGTDEEGREAERQAASMQDQLSKDVASWSKQRRQRPSETVIAPSHPAIQRRTPRPTAKSPISPTSPPPDQPVNARSKPFSMSYGGVTEAQYVQYLINRRSS